LIFDYFSKNTLKDYIQTNYTLKDVTKIISEVLNGIKLTHEHGIFH